MSFSRRALTAAGAALMAGVSFTPSLTAGQTLPPVRSKDSVTLVPYEKYDKGPFHRFLFGDNYRDVWSTPVKVPVVDLADFAGGLKPTETGGGKQTRSLKFDGADGKEWVFRPVYKALLDLPDSFRGTLILSLVMDARSASLPTAPLSASPILKAVGLLHAPSVLVAMPDDPALGEFREEFAGVLGAIEETPDDKDDPPTAAFAGADKIENSDDLLKRINKSPDDLVNPRTFLRAVLVDILLNDNDRHAGQWKWARFEDDGLWEPIPRDRDKAFIDYEGFLIGLARSASPTLVRFENTFPRPQDLFDNGVEFERRLLNGLEKTAWDSAVADVKAAVTDDVLAAAMARQPPEFAEESRGILAKLRARRDALQDGADDYYAYMAGIVDLHATDADETATVIRGEGFVTITLREKDKAPYYTRRFNADETQEIRLYLHDGDDDATVTGNAQSRITVRITGGNGDNRLTDNSTVGGRANPTRLYDNGKVSGIEYEVGEPVEEDTDSALPFNRVPVLRIYSMEVEASRDRGTRIGPTIGFRSGYGLGFTPKIGVTRTKYAFRKAPHASMQSLDVAYSTGVPGFEIGFETDNRFESTGFHWSTETRMSQIAVADFRGFGNQVLTQIAAPCGVCPLPGSTPLPDADSKYYRVNQTQYLFNPSFGYQFGPRSDVSVGPVVMYTVADSSASRFIAEARPYGFRRFGQAGAQVRLFHDTRMAADTGRNKGGIGFKGPVSPPLWGTFEFTGSVFPSMWDVERNYQNLAAVATGYLTVPVLTRPVIALRAGGQKLFGDFPWFDAAFIGGSSSLRTERRQRYAGDASLYGTAEIRLPIAKFPLVFPLDVGALGFTDVARVYFDGESPGGWHRGSGGGVWIGVINPGTNLTVIATDNPERRWITSLGFAF